MSSDSSWPPGSYPLWDQSAVDVARRQKEALNQQNLDTLRAIKEAGRSYSASAMLQDYLNSSAVAAIRALSFQQGQLRRQIQQALYPLPDLSQWRDQASAATLSAKATSASAAESAKLQLAALNSAIREATLLGAYEVSSLPRLGKATSSREKAAPEPRSSEQLIEIIPAEALARLETVEFLPLRILDEIILAPEEMHRLTPRQFEELVAEILTRLKFSKVVLTPKSGDQGRDVLASKTVSGVPILFAFECKRQSRNHKVGIATLRSLLGTISHGPTKANIGVLVTTSTFTRGAQSFILTEASVKGRDFDGVVEWLQEVRNQ